MDGDEETRASGQVIHLDLASTVDTALPIKVVMRGYLSTQHLYAARYAAEDAQKLEDQYAGKEPFNMRHRGLVLSAVAESVMFLEAAINEMFQDAADGHHNRLIRLGEGPIMLMAALWEATNSGHMKTLVKYESALRFCGHPPFPYGSAPYQDVKHLVDLRNYLVHYRPEDLAEDRQPKISGGLRGRFPDNRLMAGAANPWFPAHALGAGCAGWAWRSARAFVERFAQTTGVTFNFQIADVGDPLPS
ncbi:hypothetical protein SK854_08240 [Lentzea sp. BCCO 10_0061]|uniref:RiboL-PSP-HEPN domain-containing protein n=1 Tax=Lentzea sokolovensis TaxID=3095429 RepID=A0ABU4UTI0_9PSEU|nr:hypothetical protein [Lentzea sp. BCCO 10_0061]MDX8142096.1 hypothetical protein [Lentzea sp. BCCO 10_0061]